MNVISGAKRLFYWYAFAGTEHNSPEERLAIVLFAIAAPIGAISYLVWAVFYLTNGAVYWPASIVCALASINLLGPFIARRSRFAAEVFFSLHSVILFFLLTLMFGAKSGLHLAPLVTALLLTWEIRLKRPVVLAICITPLLLSSGVLVMWFSEPLYFQNASPEMLNTIYENNLANMIVTIVLVTLVALYRAEQAEDALSLEYKRSESLLANLLPAEVADRLKNEPGKVIADKVPAVTILFADIVGFTPRAEKMEPEALVSFLNGIFSAFDDLTAKHGLEKIKNHRRCLYGCRWNACEAA